MNQQRRSVLKYSAVFGLMASTGLISTAQAQEWNKAAFEGKGIDDVFKILSSGTPDKSSSVTLNAPDIAENGAVVPVGITTTLKAEQMAILVEKKPKLTGCTILYPSRH